MCEALELTRRVTAFIRGEGDTSEGAFNALALDVYAFQYERIALVARLADVAERPPGRVDDWRQIPAVPTTAFKQMTLFAGDESDIERTFESSGTSGSSRSRAHFSSRGLELMDVSIQANASRALLDDGRATRIVVLAPSPTLAPHMIMAYGMQRLIDSFGLSGSGFFVGPAGLEKERLMGSLAQASAEGIPITLIGASFAFVALLDGLAERGVTLPCAPGSRTMDAGGFKDRSRIVSRSELDAMLWERFAIPAERNVNLLGMTELASQLYDNVLQDGDASRRHKRPPHWMRTRVLEPLTLEDVPDGRGVLQHLDLANVERPLVIRTQDLAEVSDGAWTVVGRSSGADARGCSLSVAEWMKSGGRDTAGAEGRADV